MTLAEFKRLVSEIPEFLDHMEIEVMDYTTGLKTAFGECPQITIEGGKLFIPGFKNNKVSD